MEEWQQEVKRLEELRAADSSLKRKSEITVKILKLRDKHERNLEELAGQLKEEGKMQVKRWSDFHKKWYVSWV